MVLFPEKNKTCDEVNTMPRAHDSTDYFKLIETSKRKNTHLTLKNTQEGLENDI